MNIARRLGEATISNKIQKQYTVSRSFHSRIRDWCKSVSTPLNLDSVNRFNFYPVSHDPLVIFTYTGWNLGNVYYMAQHLSKQQAIFTVAFTRYPRRWQLLHLKRQLSLIQTIAPHHSVFFLANSPEEHANMKALQMPSWYVANNAMQREDYFSVDHSASKTYTAVMTARLARWKRIELAEGIDKLLMITIEEDDDYKSELFLRLRNAHWANYDAEGKYTYLTRQNISKLLATAHVGVILSNLEGNNRASIEYMLSGLPVVSTPSKGGRDVFFHPDHSIIVPPDPSAIAAAAEELAARSIPPEEIRETALSKIKDHRSRYLSHIHDVTRGAVDIDPAKWLDLFPNNMEHKCDSEEFLEHLLEFRGHDQLL